MCKTTFFGKIAYLGFKKILTCFVGFLYFLKSDDPQNIFFLSLVIYLFIYLFIYFWKYIIVTMYM